MNKITMENIDVFFNQHHTIKNLSLSIPTHCITAIIGPNGSGKSTLLKTLAGLIKPNQGKIAIDQQSIELYSRKKLAKKISFLSQNPDAPENISVKELVSLGRYCHQSWLGFHAKDREHIQWAIQQVGLENKINEPLSRLSGGQRKRAWLAMALAQDSDTLLLDEPTAFLDIRHQLEMLFMIQKLKLHLAKTIVLVLHDLQQVFQFADHLIIINHGEVIYSGAIHANIDMHIFEKVFGVKIQLFKHAENQMLLAFNRADYA